MLFLSILGHDRADWRGSTVCTCIYSSRDTIVCVQYPKYGSGHGKSLTFKISANLAGFAFFCCHSSLQYLFVSTYEEEIITLLINQMTPNDTDLRKKNLKSLQIFLDYLILLTWFENPKYNWLNIHCLSFYGKNKLKKKFHSILWWDWDHFRLKNMPSTAV